MNNISPHVSSLGKIVLLTIFNSIGIIIGIVLATIVDKKMKDKNIIIRIMIITVIIGFIVFLCNAYYFYTRIPPKIYVYN